MREIKSVRVRKKNSSDGALDIRVVLFDKLLGTRSVKGVDANLKGFDPSQMKALWSEIEYSGKRYKDYTNDQLLSEYIEVNSKIVSDQTGNVLKDKLYEIIQDPWNENPPIFRSFGFDPYYLNNGSEVTIQWFESNGSTVAGGLKWSDDNGNELSIPKGSTSSDKSSYIKQAESFYTKNSERLMLTDNGLEKWSFDSKPYKFMGSVSDKDIIDFFISKWTSKVANYDLKLCDPNNQKCEVIGYKSPIEPPTDQPVSESSNTGTSKSKLILKLPDQFDVMQREDVPEFTILFGEPLVINDGFVFAADELVVGDEYSEDDFKAIEESYNDPDLSIVDDVLDVNDPNRGEPEESSTLSEPNSLNVQPSKPDSTKLKDIINYACLSTYYPKGNKKSAGKCARYTFNHANNFVRTLLKKDSQGNTCPAGGNANQEGYFKALERLGYKRVDNGTVSKKDLIKVLSDKSKWNIGDVVCYWGVNPSPSDANQGGVKYGHTQIFTNGNHGTSNPWTSDNEGNFKCSFVYNKYKVETWRFIIFKSPTSTLEGQKKYGVA